MLADSFYEHHPDGTCTVLVIDDPEGTIDAGGEPFEIVRVEEIGIPALREMIIRYDVTEFSTAVKPWFLKYMLERGASHVVYFDPDIQIFAPLDDIGELAERHGIVLTPHTTEPIPRDGEKPTEYDILLSGMYNLGFLALGASDTSTRFLDWWGERLLKECLIDHSKALFVDQRWVDFVPSLFPDTKLLRDPGCNVAYWNLHARKLEREGTAVTVNGQPLRFFHFSGFDPNRPFWLSKHATRVRVTDNPILVELCRSYAALLVEHGYEEAIRMPYKHSQLPNGIPFDRRVRRLYENAVAGGEDFGNVFEPGGADAFFRWLNAPSQQGGHHGVTRFMHDGIYAERPDVQQAFNDLNGPAGAEFVRWFVSTGRREHSLPDQFVPAEPNGLPSAPAFGSAMSFVRRIGRHRHPEPDQPVPAEPDPAKDGPKGVLDAGPIAAIDGVNVAGYLKAELGLGEAARQYVTALQSAGIPVSTKTFGATSSRQNHEFVELTSSKGYSTNLICVNADQLALFHREVGDEFFKGRRSIGVWAWEVNIFPEEWSASFEFVDEIWVPSTYVAEIISRVSPKPVVTVPLPVTAPDPGGADVDLGVPEGFTFLFLFDFFSTIQRKNPLGLVEAFKRAFVPGEGPQLVIKSINGSHVPDLLEQLRLAAFDRPDIHVVDRYLTSQEKNALMVGCSCYVSLHRSEGFGLTLAETMALGKPVIATGFSGNTDFMTNSNSYLVDYTMTEVGPGSEPYPPDGVWAEPDLGHAARLMRQVWENQDEARARGERARRDVKRTLSPEVIGDIARARLERLAAPSPVPAPPLDQSEGFDSKSLSDVNEQLQSVEGKLASGPPVGAPSRFGRAGKFARRLALRSVWSYVLYAREIDAAVVDALRQTTRALEQVESEARARVDTLGRRAEQVESKIYALGQRSEQVESEIDALGQRSEQIGSETRARVDALGRRSERIGEHLSAFEQAVIGDVRRLDAELSKVVAGIRARPAADHPLLSYTAESGKAVLGFRDVHEDGLSEGDMYRAFQDVFRDDELAIKDRQAWYADMVADRSWVLDVGCGRGEFLELLRDRGVKGIGVDIDQGMADRCRAKGHDIVLNDVNTYLRKQDDGSIPVIFAAQLIEHLPYEYLMVFLRLANEKLEPEGILIVETINPHSPVAFKAFWTDLTHQHPIFPEVALTLCRLAGFRSGRVVFPNGSDDLEEELFSAGDYAVIATKEPRGYEPPA